MALIAFSTLAFDAGAEDGPPLPEPELALGSSSDGSAGGG